MSPPVLALEGVSLGIGAVTIVEDLTLSLAAGEIVALVGESGAGKSLTALALAGLLPPGGWLRGSVTLDGRRIDPMDEAAMHPLRGRALGLIVQDPVAGLDPGMRIGAQLIETLRLHRRLTRQQARAAAVAALERVGIKDAAGRIDRYPFELSGGKCQRVMIALALAGHPGLLIADEPTSALDAAVQADILALLCRLTAEERRAMLLISHDLDLVAGAADRIAVLYAGRIVEAGPAAEVLAHPRHPYSAALVGSRLDGRQPAKTPLPTLPGVAPRPQAYPAGCRFHPRCASALTRCAVERPPWSGTAGHGLACWLEAPR